MKGKLNNYLLKLFSLVLAFILVFPTEIFAMAMDDKASTYNASTSIMGLATQTQNPEENSTESTEEKQTLIKSEISTDETDEYLIEKSATLSKTTGQIDYKILVKSKKSDDKDKNQTAIFAITQNTDLKDLRVEKVQKLSADGTEKDAEYTQNTASLFTPQDNQRTFGITTTSAENAMVYYLSAKLSDEALADIDKKSPNMDLEFAIKKLENIYQSRYALEIAKPQENDIIIDHNGDLKNQEESLKEITDNTHQYKAIYKEESQGLFANTPAQITWTDYINNKDDKEFTYDINLDQNQETSESQINIQYYEASEKGYILNESFTKTIPFTNSLKLTIPQAYIAQVELTTRPKENVKEYTFNGAKVANPTYKEEKTPANEESKKEDTDPLPAEEKSETQKAEETQRSKESNKESTASTQSAIALNKDAYISGLKENNKLTTNLEKATNQFAFVLESYNNDDITWDDFVVSVQNIAKAQKIDPAQAEEIISALLVGLNADKYKVANIDIKEAAGANSDNEESSEAKVEEGAELPADKLSEEEIKAQIKEEFAKEKSGQISEDELEVSLEKIRNENNIERGDFFNILADLYKNEEITSKDLENSSKSEELPAIDTEKSIEEVLSDKLAEENLSTEDFIRFLQSYVKSYEIEENELQAILTENQDEVEKVIGDLTIDEILAAAYHEGLNPQILAADENANITDAGISNERFITELEYSTETLTRATNEDKLFEIAKTYPPDSTNSSDQVIRNNYVGWKINIPGVDITEIKKDKKYDYQNINFSIYAPAGQSLEGYKVVVEDEEDGKTAYSGTMTEKKGDHYVYGFSIPKDQLSEKGYNIYVVAKAPKKRQNYAIGLKVAPDNNYVLSLKERSEAEFKEFSEKYPLLIKWIDTSAANPYVNGINLIDTRMVYLEPNGWQDLFPYNGFKSIDYNDNVTDTDLMKNRVSMFGNIDKNGQITWTISETFPAEKLENKNTVGRDAYSAETDGQGLTGPSVQILVPNGKDYTVKDLGTNVDIATLQSQIGNQPGTIVNYTFKEQAKDKDKLTTLSLDSGKSASIAHKPVLERKPKDVIDQTGLKYLHKVQEHNDGPGYEIALSNDQAHTMKAFIPKNLSANPRYNDPDFNRTGVVVFCLNPGKPEPTRQYKFNGTITKGEWKTDKGSWAQNGRALAALATANEAKASPLYKGKADDTFYASLYEHILRLYWYGQELAEEYQLDEQSYYKIIQYNLYYWLAGENYAENFRNGGGYNPNYFSSAEYSYAQGLKKRIEAGKDWDKVNYDEDIQIFYYGHDKTRSYQNTITGDTKRKAKKGSVTVNKVDNKKNNLHGAYFQLLDANQNPIKTLITDENGVALFDDLDYGTYYIKEVQGPKGYQFTDQLSEVQVNKEQAHVTFNHTNKINEIDFKKVDENGFAMANVTFELRRNGRVLDGQDQTSGKKGWFGWKELTPGYYEVVEKEIKDPAYSENIGRVVASFRVDENNKVQDKVIYYPNGKSNTDIVNKKNEGKPIGIEFTKIDAKTGNPLEGAEFVLEYRKPDSSIFRELPGSKRRSTSDGKLVWNELVDGDYRVIETKAPDDNKYDTELNLGEKATFTIEKNKSGYYEITNKTPTDLIITNTEKPEEPKIKTGEFEFTKEDKETKDKLQGVEFTLTSEGKVGEKGKEFDYKVSKTTDENGKIKFETLYPGTYTLEETKQLPGYVENTKTWTVVVDEEGNAKVEGGKYKIETSGEDTFSDSYVSLKASISKTRTEGTLLYTISIKPIRNIHGIQLDPSRENKFSGELVNTGLKKILNLKQGEWQTFSYTFSIKDINNITKNSPISPLQYVHVLENELGSTHVASVAPTFTVVENSGPLTITNEKEKPEPANLTIKKVDSETKIGLEGAKFELYRTKEDAMSRTGIVDYATTNEHGYAVFDSPEIAGDKTYYVKEIAAPDGYKITKAITEVKSSASEDNEINAEIPNEKNNARFELYKKDSEGNYLEGAKFKLLDSNKTLVEEKTTDANGYIKFDNLQSEKTYYLIESQAPEGFNKKGAELKLIVDKDGNVSWGDNSLVEEKYTGPNVTEIEGPRMTWSATEDHKLDSDPSYLNTREYAELTNPETGEVEYYVMLKALDFEGSGTNTGTILQLTTRNATIKQIDLYEADFYTPGVKERISQAMKDGSIASNADLKLATAANDYAGNITINSSVKNNEVTNSLVLEDNANYANIKFPYNNDKKIGRFDNNWAYVAKVTAHVTDKSQAARVQYRWNHESNAGIYIENYQEVPPIKDPSKETIVEPPTFTVINEKRPSIDFIKQDGTSGVPLEGAEFVLEEDGKEVTNSLTSSGADGKFGFDNLEDGSYKVYETAPPEGYPYLGQIVVATFAVKDGKVTELNTNQLYGNTSIDDFEPNKEYPIYNKVNEIKFKKLGKNNKPLADAKFKLDIVWDSYDENGKIQPHRDTVLKDITTADDGLISLSATKPGRYQLVETKAPQGYKVSNTGQIVAEFTVEAGTLSIKSILVGDKYYQNLTKDTELLEIVNKEKGEGKFQVNKVDNFNNQLAGARFLLKDINTNQYVMTDGTLTTNSANALTDGATVDYKNLPAGEYELREFKSPDGYVRTINTWKVSVDENSNTTIKIKDNFDKLVKATISNETTDSPASLTLVNKSNEIEFTKVEDSETTPPLAGVEFEIWWDQQGNIENRYGDTKKSQYKNYVKIKNSDGGTVFTTDSYGKFKLSNLKTGHYKIYETKIPDFYKVTDQPTDNEPIKDASGEFVNEFYVDIDGYIKKNDNGIVGGDDDVLVTIIKNTPITGKFRVQKVGEDGVEKLEGAEFELYKVIGENVDKENPIKAKQVITQDEQVLTGLVEFADLENGEYLLEETKAPKGYGISNTTWNISVNDGKVNITSTNGSADFTRTDDTITLNVINKKASYPSTGGNGAFIGFAIIGTAVMLAGIAYFAIYQNDKNRRRSDRYGK